MKLQIPIGSEIAENNRIEIPIPNTSYWVVGERVERNLWNIYLVDPRSTYKELITKNITTEIENILRMFLKKTVLLCSYLNIPMKRKQ